MQQHDESSLFTFDKRENKRPRRRGRRAAAAAVTTLVLAGAAYQVVNSRSSEKTEQTAPAPDRKPRFSDTAKPLGLTADQDAVWERNHEVGVKVQGSVERRLGSLPERIRAFAERHSYTQSSTESGIPGDTGNMLSFENDDLNAAARGTKKNMLIRPEQDNPDSKRYVFQMQWQIPESGQRDLNFLAFSSWDRQDPTKEASVVVTQDNTGNYYVEYPTPDQRVINEQDPYFMVDRTGLEPTVVDPDRVEELLAHFDKALDG